MYREFTNNCVTLFGTIENIEFPVAPHSAPSSGHIFTATWGGIMIQKLLKIDSL